MKKLKNSKRVIELFYRIKMITNTDYEVNKNQENLIKEYKKTLIYDAERLLSEYINTHDLHEYISEIRLNEKLSQKTILLTQLEMRFLLRKNYSYYTVGITYKNKCYVDVHHGTVLETIIHENLHRLSFNGKFTGIKNSKKMDAINEAITQMFTLLIMRTQNSEYENKENMYDEVANVIGKFCSNEEFKELLIKSYFQNSPDLIKKYFDTICWKGYFKTVCNLIDKTIYYNSKNEKEQALNELTNLYDIYESKVEERYD